MAPKNFYHPFQPYEIQQQFMEAMYACIEDGKVGIFESPTGTGKSLSLICSSLTWLREHKRKKFDAALAAIEVDDDEPDWMLEHARESRSREMRQMREDLEARLAAVREKERKVRQRSAEGGHAHKKRKIDSTKGSAHADEDQYLLDDYNSDDEAAKDGAAQSEYSTQTTKLMEKLGMTQQQKQDVGLQEDADELKVYFCSRTHSQLSQFVGELQRVKLPSGMPSEPSGRSDDPDHSVESVKQLSLGSRKNLCINPKVTKLGNQKAINERCIELQQSSTPSEHKCPFMPNKDNEDLVLDFRDHALANIRDIEELAEVGSTLGVCPYYASRPAIGPAEIITLPYPLLLQKSAREALGISLKGHVVVIDEAHNLINAIESTYSTEISERQLKRAREALIAYLLKFRNRLKGSNRVYIAQVVRVIDSMLSCTAELGSSKTSGGILDSSQLLSGKGVDQVNLAKLVRYINDSKLARKVEGYVAHVGSTQKSEPGKATSATSEPEAPTLTHVQNFLTTLMNPSKEGRFFWSREGEGTLIRYLLLDPSEHFRDIVNDARAVILAGGTMSPMEDCRNQLLPYLPSLVTFSCGHLIPPSNLLVRAVSGDQEGPLEFSYRSRNASTAMRVGKALLRIAPTVRGGLVVFLPSYGFLDQLADSWRTQQLVPELQKVMPLFWDDRSGSAEETFKAYSHAIATSSKGAILLSVIGGKLSEGINFSDDLGRCVVVVGLPFPNLETPEWKAKMQYIDGKAVARGESKGKASREHAENVCMRAVNQAVGRVIRHKDDWASIVLLDSRYTQLRVREKLPGWIKGSFPVERSSQLVDVATDVKGFFDGKQDR